MLRALLASAALIVLAACSAHSPMILKNTTNVTPVGAGAQAAHSDQVLVVEGPLPAGVEYEAIGAIDIGKIWYTGNDGLLVEMAQRARTMGADAVINVKRWRQPSGFAWAAPHGHGDAVKLRDKAQLQELAKLGKML